METSAFLKSISGKKFDAAGTAEHALEEPSLIDEAILGLSSEQATIKYRCEKVLRTISASRPEMLYPQFDFYVGLLDGDNTILKWGAIATIANLTHVDRENKFELIFNMYFAAIRGPVMITAANTIRAGATIAAAKPELADRICKEILKVQGARYKTPECRNVAIGHAIDALDEFWELVHDKRAVTRFVEKQLQNTRAAVRKRAVKFLKNHPG